MGIHFPKSDTAAVCCCLLHPVDFLALSVVTESSVNERMDSATAGGTLRTVTDIAIKSSDLLQSGGAAGIKSGVSELELPHWGTFLPAVGHTATAGTEPVDAASGAVQVLA